MESQQDLHPIRIGHGSHTGLNWGPNTVPMNPMSIQNMALLCIIFTVAHVYTHNTTLTRHSYTYQTMNNMINITAQVLAQSEATSQLHTPSLGPVSGAGVALGSAHSIYFSGKVCRVAIAAEWGVQALHWKTFQMVGSRYARSSPARLECTSCLISSDLYTTFTIRTNL